MQITDILKHEHRVIEHALNALERAAVKLRKGEISNLSDTNNLLEFFSVFADKCHHAKEEDILFPSLERRGIPRGGGPIGVMLFEHDKGRELRSRMTNVLSTLASDDKGRWVFIRSAEEFIELLRGHILKEDNILFEMAAQVLSPKDDEDLAELFEAKEREMGEGVHEKYHALIHELEERI